MRTSKSPRPFGESYWELKSRGSVWVKSGPDRFKPESVDVITNGVTVYADCFVLALYVDDCHQNWLAEQPQCILSNVRVKGNPGGPSRNVKIFAFQWVNKIALNTVNRNNLVCYSGVSILPRHIYLVILLSCRAVAVIFAQAGHPTSSQAICRVFDARGPTVLSVPHRHWKMHVFCSNSTTRFPSVAWSFFNGSVFDHWTAHLERASRSIPEDGRCRRRSFRMTYAESIDFYINRTSLRGLRQFTYLGLRLRIQICVDPRQGPLIVDWQPRELWRRVRGGKGWWFYF